MVSSPSPPPAPDPAATASAQTASNQQTALYQAGLNDVNQNTPLGNISYDIGTQDVNGTTIPRSTSNITLNPDVQNALTSNLKTSSNLANLGNQYVQNADNQLSQPYNINANVGAAPTPDAAYQQKIMGNMNALEQPYVDRSNELLQSSLVNQGITQGSQAYHNAMLDQNNSLNNLQQQNIQNATQQEQAQYGMAQQGYQQNLSNYNQQYNQPLNEVSALQSGSQVSQPSFAAPSQTSVNPTNVAGIYNQDYQNRLGASNAATASSNQMLGGLFGLGGSLGSAAIMASDRRLKTNIKRIGTTAGGVPVYRYNYIWDKKTPQIGVMADEVNADAVITDANGIKYVDYGRVHA